MSRPLPHYPSQRDRDDAGAAAGLIALVILVLILGLAAYGLAHLAGLLP